MPIPRQNPVVAEASPDAVTTVSEIKIMELPFVVPNKMDEDVTNAFGGGITMFGMDFASKGLSWAGNVYQKWENICRDNIMVQEPSKLVDAVGEQFRKIYEEVADDLLNPFSLGSGEVQASDLSSDQDITADVCEKSETSHRDRLNEEPLIFPTSISSTLEEGTIASLPGICQDERKEACDIRDNLIALEYGTSHGYILNEEPLISPTSILSTSLEGEKIASLPDVCQDERKEALNILDNLIALKSGTSHGDRLNEDPLISLTSTMSTSLEEEKSASLPDICQDERKEACDILDNVIAFTPAEATRCSCSSEVSNNREEVLNSSTFLSHSGHLPSTGVFLSETPGSIVERGFMPSCSTDPTKEEGNSSLQEIIALLQPFSTVHEQRSSSELEASLSIIDAKKSDIFDKDITKHSVAVNENVETNDEFEDVNLEDFCEGKKQEDCLEEAENYELVLISCRAIKNRSYKKKLRDVFTSRFYRLKKNNNDQGASFYGDVNTDPANKSTPVASSVSGRVLEASNLSTLESCESDWELL